MSNKNKRYGKHRAIVVDINDPQKRGRVRVKCPTVFGESLSGWCEACVPNARDIGGDSFILSPGDHVWVEFEDGNTSLPIYTGGWYIESPTEGSRTFSYNGGKVIISSDVISVETSDGTKVQVSSGNVYINGSAVALKNELHSH